MDEKYKQSEVINNITSMFMQIDRSNPSQIFNTIIEAYKMGYQDGMESCAIRIGEIMIKDAF